MSQNKKRISDKELDILINLEQNTMYVLTNREKMDVISALKELKRYRKIGPTPEQLKEIDRLYLEKCKELEEYSKWIPAENPPDDDNFVLLSFENFSIPLIGRYKRYDDGSGNYFCGDCDEEDTCLADGLFVKGWRKLPVVERG